MTRAMASSDTNWIEMRRCWDRGLTSPLVVTASTQHIYPNTCHFRIHFWCFSVGFILLVAPWALKWYGDANEWIPWLKVAKSYVNEWQKYVKGMSFFQLFWGALKLSKKTMCIVFCLFQSIQSEGIPRYTLFSSGYPGYLVNTWIPEYMNTWIRD